MATEEPKDINRENAAEEPSLQKNSADSTSQSESEDINLSAGNNHEEISELEAFAGDEDFYELLEESRNPFTLSAIQKSLIKLRVFLKLHFSSMQKTLLLSIFAVIALFLYVLFRNVADTEKGPSASYAGGQIQPLHYSQNFGSSSTIDSNVPDEDIEPTLPGPQQSQPLSLNVAQNYFEQKQYYEAFSVYEQMRQALDPADEFIRDYFDLKMAMCAIATNDLEPAYNLLRKVSQSNSPIVRILANYHFSLIEIRRKRYLLARARIYNALALIKAIDIQTNSSRSDSVMSDTNKWLLAFECDCYFSAAECLTRYILSLGNNDGDIPDDLWINSGITAEPFTNMDEQQLRTFLESGSQYLKSGLLDPKIKKLDEENIAGLWSVASHEAPVEELLSKFASSADIDIELTGNGDIAEESVLEILQKKSVSLYLPGVDPEQLFFITAGSAGLAAFWDEQPEKITATIYNPSNYTSLDEHITLLCEHAVLLWQQYVLKFNSDGCLGNAHFAMALLQSQTTLKSEAIAEYKIVANRFSQTSLAPFASFNSGKLKASLRDYTGAREDLKQLIEYYPDSEIYEQAYLFFADVTLQAQLVEEAAEIYSRIHKFSLFEDTKNTAAFGAAKCLYQAGSYEQASKWLPLYIESVKNSANNNIYSAYYMLGKTYLALGNLDQACYAFRRALSRQITREQYVEVITSLAQGQMEFGNYVEALNVLENTHSVALSEQQSVELLMLKSSIYREIGLSDSSVDILQERLAFISDSRLKIKILFELAQSYIANGSLELAQHYLGQIISDCEPGEPAHIYTLTLAEVCLKQNQFDETISVCQGLLNSEIPDDIRQESQKIIAEAYSGREDYDKAVLALSGQLR